MVDLRRLGMENSIQDSKASLCINHFRMSQVHHLNTELLSLDGLLSGIQHKMQHVLGSRAITRPRIGLEIIWRHLAIQLRRSHI